MQPFITEHFQMLSYSRYLNVTSYLKWKHVFVHFIKGGNLLALNVPEVLSDEKVGDEL